ncbi:hypothetical protein BJ508DRAFT_313547 [Ascobolus immersus RN42]|uniref:Uncharacterized protein n=1 Tax=Ascobolus immersus RN42 TaxID=1160509 RepID=A0A3N4HMD9_ASCIM|nr:hypothetical protein BJ508DRAFT_313547 [Ascobolus immersus RN42]
MPGKLSQRKITTSQRRVKTRSGDQPQQIVDPAATQPNASPTPGRNLQLRITRLEAKRRPLQNSIAMLNLRAKDVHSSAEAIKALEGSLPRAFRPIRIPEFETITAGNVERSEEDLRRREEQIARERMLVKLCEEIELTLGSTVHDNLSSTRACLEAHERYRDRCKESGLGAKDGIDIEAQILELREDYREASLIDSRISQLADSLFGAGTRMVTMSAPSKPYIISMEDRIAKVIMKREMCTLRWSRLVELHNVHLKAMAKHWHKTSHPDARLFPEGGLICYMEPLSCHTIIACEDQVRTLEQKLDAFYAYFRQVAQETDAHPLGSKAMLGIVLDNGLAVLTWGWYRDGWGKQLEDA